MSLIVPIVLAVPVGQELRRRSQIVAGELPVEKIGRFADVIVDAHDHHIVHVHVVLR